MKFVGFNFSKINVERLSGNLENLKIDTKIDVSSIGKVKGNLINKSEEIIKAEFSYDINYNPDFAKISLSGEAFISDKSDIIKRVIKRWDKDKKLEENFKVFLFNIILRKCNLKALQMEDEMNFPLHLPLPSVKKENSN